IRYSRRPGQRFAALAALGKAAAIGRELGQPPQWFDRLRNEAIAALALPDVHITRELDGFPPGTVAADFSEDFELYARTDKRGGCSIRRVGDGAELFRLPELGEPVAPRFGPGRLLSVFGVTSQRLRVWDLGGPEPVSRLEETKPVYSWDFDRDGRHLAAAHTDGVLSIYEVATGAPRGRFGASGVTREPVVRLHPAEPLAAVCSYFRPGVLVRDTRSGRVAAEIDTPWQGGSSSAEWSPDGRTLAVTAGDGPQIQLYAFDPAAPAFRPGRLMEGGRRGGRSLASTRPATASPPTAGTASSTSSTSPRGGPCSPPARCRLWATTTSGSTPRAEPSPRPASAGGKSGSASGRSRTAGSTGRCRSGRRTPLYPTSRSTPAGGSRSSGPGTGPEPFWRTWTGRRGLRPSPSPFPSFPRRRSPASIRRGRSTPTPSRASSAGRYGPTPPTRSG
ncbi:MAG TPA: hypothetical protein VIL46_01165, partial [Gemmataceae bacterium]